MDKQKWYDKVCELYGKSDEEQLRKGKLLSRETTVGYFGVTILSELFRAFKEINLSKSKSLLDLGSGDGRVVMIASLFTKATGVEGDPALHARALSVNARLSKDGLSTVRNFILQDYFSLPLSEYDFIYIDPDKPFYRGVEDKLRRDFHGDVLIHGIHYLPLTLPKVKEISGNLMRFTLYRVP